MLQGVLHLCGMHDSEAKPVLMCSCNDNCVRIYDLPSWVSHLSFSSSLTMEFILTKHEGDYDWFDLSLILDLLRGARFMLKMRFEQLKSVLGVCSSPVMELVKWESGNGGTHLDSINLSSQQSVILFIILLFPGLWNNVYACKRN